MRITLLIPILYLSLAGCATKAEEVYDANGQVRGTVVVKEEHVATYFDANGREIGRLEKGAVRDRTGRVIASVFMDTRGVRALNAEGGEVAVLQDGHECVNELGREMGVIRERIAPDAAVAACVLLLVF